MWRLSFNQRIRLDSIIILDLTVKLIIEISAKLCFYVTKIVLLCQQNCFYDCNDKDKVFGCAECSNAM